VINCGIEAVDFLKGITMVERKEQEILTLALPLFSRNR
jgi:hypothetical protein